MEYPNGNRDRRAMCRPDGRSNRHTRRTNDETELRRKMEPAVLPGKVRSTEPGAGAEGDAVAAAAADAG